METVIEMLQTLTTINKWLTFIGFLLSQIMLITGIVRMSITERPGGNYWFNLAIDAMQLSLLPAFTYLIGKIMLEALGYGL